MEVGYVQAQADNLPKINSVMMALFFKSSMDFSMAEFRGVKAEKSARESYGDNAIGYVQVKREKNICYVKGKITPEHRIRKKAYSVLVSCDEKEEVVLAAKCEDCTASQGGCKHAIAFLAWIHRRSEDPPSTSTECFWKKSSLAAVGSSVKPIKVIELGKKRVVSLPQGDGTHLKKFIKVFQQHDEVANTQFANYFLPKSDPQTLSLHLMYNEFSEISNDVDAFFAYAQGKMSAEICSHIENLTKYQAESSLWHELRYARITASKIHAAAHCNTLDGSLVETILGAKFRDSAAMKRGRMLESQVIKLLSKRLNKPIKQSGLWLSAEYPIFGASPDGLGEDFVVEVKCPASDKTFRNYFSNDANGPAKKHNAQMQLQMCFAKKERAVFCVAHPDFEFSNATTELWVNFDKQYCEQIIAQAQKFWCKAIFPRLQK